MKNNIMIEFVISQTVEELCKKNDWNIEVLQRSRKNFYSAKEQDPYSKRWEDTTFKVSFPNTIQVVDLEFYGLYWDCGTGWMDVGVSFENSVHENCFHQIAHLVSMTPVFLDSLKKGLKYWGELLEKEADTVMEARKENRLEDLREKVKATRTKIQARDPKLAEYYEPNHSLDCQEFLLVYVIPGE